MVTNIFKRIKDSKRFKENQNNIFVLNNSLEKRIFETYYARICKCNHKQALFVKIYSKFNLIPVVNK
jgi:hypothetical protein